MLFQLDELLANRASVVVEFFGQLGHHHGLVLQGDQNRLSVPAAFNKGLIFPVHEYPGKSPIKAKSRGSVETL